MELNARYDLKRLATAESDDGLDRLELNELRFSDDYWGPFQNNRFFMVRRVSECDDMRYDLIFNDVRTAAAEFGKRFCVKTGDGRKFFPFGRVVQWTDDWKYVRDELLPYSEYEEKDYGPSNPWDAPGMKVSDFIRGVVY